MYRNADVCTIHAGARIVIPLSLSTGQDDADAMVAEAINTHARLGNVREEYKQRQVGAGTLVDKQYMCVDMLDTLHVCYLMSIAAVGQGEHVSVHPRL